MTSTPFNVGLTNESKLTSRVLKPPGGGHTDIFGIHQQEPEPVRTGRRAAPQKTADQIQLAPHESPKKEEPEEIQATNGNGNHAAGESITDSCSEHYEEAKHEIVEEKREQMQSEPAKAEPQKRERVPPGGYSTKLW